MNIIIFGDSIACGANDWKNGGWVHLLKMHVAKSSGYSNEFYDLSIDGDDSKGVVKRIQQELKPRMCRDGRTAVIIAIGVNDSYYFGMDEKKTNVSEADFAKNLGEIIKISRKLGCEIAFLGIGFVEDSKVQPTSWRKDIYYSSANCKKYNEILKQACRKNKIPFLDSFTLLSKSKYINDLDDGLHPEIEGHKIIFELVLKFLKEDKILK